MNKYSDTAIEQGYHAVLEGGPFDGHGLRDPITADHWATFVMGIGFIAYRRTQRERNGKPVYEYVDTSKTIRRIMEKEGEK